MFKRKMNNKGIASVVAAAILLAAIVTAAITYQAFIVPEQDRQDAFNHSQNILDSFEQLYTLGESTFSLSYSGSSFFSPTTFTGELSFEPSTTLYLNVTNATQLSNEQMFLTNQGNISVQSLSEATMCLENVTGNIKATYIFIQNQQLTLIQITTENVTFYPPIVRISLNITFGNITSSDNITSYNIALGNSSAYSYSLLSGDSLQLPLFAPLYGLESTLNQTSQIYYSSNSSSCSLFIQYLAPEYTNLTYVASGAISYTPIAYPLSYIATPWGITAIEAGTSSIPTPLQIQWAQNTLILNLYNITWGNIGTISGNGPVGIKFNEYSTTRIDTTFNSITMNFTSADPDFNFQNSIMQLQTILQNNVPSGISITIQHGSNWSILTINGYTNASITIHNVDVVLS